MIKVITADDHALIREGIKHILETTSDIEVVDEAGNGMELLRKLEETFYDVIILDLNMPGMDAFDLIQKVQQVSPESSILVLTMLPDKNFGLQVLRAGVLGYLNKSGDLSDLVPAIRKVHGKERFVGQSLVEKLADRLDEGGETMPHELLSEREFQVMCMLAKGETPTEIGDQLKLSVKTVSTYRKRLLEKMGVKNNAQLTYYAINNRLV